MDGLVGYRFLPTSEDLVHFLKKKRRDSAFGNQIIKEVDVYKYHPCELAGLSPIQSDDQVWYFYSTLDQKYARSGRTCRTVKGGSWKFVGKDRVVKDNHNRPIGIEKTLVFYQGCNFRTENRTNWVLREYHEYYLNKDPISKCNQVIFRIERKQTKKHGLSSALDGSQPSYTLGYDSLDNEAQGALPELLQDLHLTSDSNNQVTDNHLMEVESQLLPIKKMTLQHNCFCRGEKVYPLIPARRDPFTDCCGMDHYSLSTLMPIGSGFNNEEQLIKDARDHY